MDKKISDTIFNVLTVCTILLFCFVIIKSLILSGTNSDLANMVLRSNDILNGDILCSKWHELVFYTTDLLFYDIAAAISGISVKSIYIATFLMAVLFYFSSVILIKDRGLSSKNILLLLLLIGISIDLYIHTAAFAYSFISLFFLNKYLKNGKTKNLTFSGILLLLALVGDKITIPLLVIPVSIYCIVKLIYNKNDYKKYLNTLITIGITFAIFFILSKIFYLLDIGIYERNLPRTCFVPIFVVANNFKLFLLQLMYVFKAEFWGQPVNFAAAGKLVRFAIILCGFAAAYNEIKNLLKNKTVDLITSVLALGIYITTVIMLITNINFGFTHLRYITFFPFAFGIILFRKLDTISIKLLAPLLIILFIPVMQSLDENYSTLIKSENPQNLIKFLKANNLINGLGTYWNASNITLLTQNELKIRCFIVRDGKITQDKTNTNYDWYNERFNFILLNNPDTVKPEELPKPDEIINFEEYKIYKYKNPVEITRLTK